MDKWLKVSIMTATLLVGAGAFSFYHFAFSLPGTQQARRDSEGAEGPVVELRLAQGRSPVEDCHEAARMVYDVHWAAACMTEVGQAGPGRADGHAECELPDDKAAVVNAWLNQAEERCMAEVRAGLEP